MISVQDSKTLFSLLNADQRPLGEIISDFSSKFPLEMHFRICCSLAVLLEDKKMLKPTQRLVAFAILHQTHSSQPFSANPFISLVIDAACDDVAEKMERAFILQLLGSAGAGNSKEV
ncbi:CCR4-NOT transcription complex subunit 11-like [Macadamia integrifolia]|uniref:CCR4-NOT transcription complex subunit 11-like n=1 Tax=Macadamia integrifolia TaxID=60698 RepID=UPI001C4F604D|nr:CCR4-NOT transcription complex subunit 11-like [Macadamia integrifolia]